MAKTNLLIEDEPDKFKLPCQILTSEGYQVLSYSADLPVQEIIAGADLLLIDQRLPGEWGTRICQELKSAAGTRHIPLLLLPATNRSGQAAREAAADEILYKPFSTSDLVLSVASCMGGS